MKSAIILILLAVLSAGCSGPKKQVPVSGDISVTDFRGKTVRLQQPAQRVVCLIESALSGIYILQAQERLVGIPTSVYRESVAPQYALLDERIRRQVIPAPGNWDFVNLESLVALRPDLVIIWASQEDAVGNIERFGIPVYGVMLRGLKDVYKEIDDFGMLLGKKERAQQLIKWTRNELQVFQVQGKNTQREKIYFMWSQGLLHTAGKKSTVNEILEAAGAANACPLNQEHCVINIEALLSWKPDLIVMWHNERMDPQDVLADSRLQTLPAVRKGQVRELPSVFFCDMWTLKFQYVIKMVAKWSDPQRFSTVDLSREKSRMLRFLYGEQAGELLE